MLIIAHVQNVALAVTLGMNALYRSMVLGTTIAGPSLLKVACDSGIYSHFFPCQGHRDMT